MVEISNWCCCSASSLHFILAHCVCVWHTIGECLPGASLFPTITLQPCSWTAHEASDQQAVAVSVWKKKKKSSLVNDWRRQLPAGLFDFAAGAQLWDSSIVSWASCWVKLQWLTLLFLLLLFLSTHSVSWAELSWSTRLSMPTTKSIHWQKVLLSGDTFRQTSGQSTSVYICLPASSASSSSVRVFPGFEWLVVAIIRLQ